MTRLGIAMGAEPLQHLQGFRGLGDLVLACTQARLSRNRTVGLRLGKKLKDILASMRWFAEGVKTTKAVYALSKRYDIEMPIPNRGSIIFCMRIKM